MIKQTITDAAFAKQEEKNHTDAFADKGMGVPLEERDDDADAKDNFAKRDLEYPEMQLILAKEGVVKKQSVKGK